MKHLSEKRIAQAQDRFAFLGPITFRSQFGGYGLLANGIMFALVSEGEMYLRANERTEYTFKTYGMCCLVYSKRGIPVTLRYYWITPELWQDESNLSAFAQLAYQGAEEDVVTKSRETNRLKDLPNVTIALERLLWKVGIKNADELRSEGAKRTYLRLRALRKSLGINVLLSLAGAITGNHHAVLPRRIRNELMEWFDDVGMPVSACYKN
ncbi:DNA transformation protein tfoX [Yersinia entomophaga]|uniref:DNA transformation protein tfoX n=1 Tax=Yersinia entomophaga TaxID=935293 RepID=A0ABM6BH31_YERET|nr:MULTISPECIES: TfoX/Sxy family DNA transformation protein [Yersinia]ANI28776.1 DNA transformation protein tfoX [Yersinia entomophaga]OWF89693.1 DNA transformation protein tfoX [Yersinia entomophaga]